MRESLNSRGQGTDVSRSVARTLVSAVSTLLSRFLRITNTVDGKGVEQPAKSVPMSRDAADTSVRATRGPDLRRSEVFASRIFAFPFCNRQRQAERMHYVNL